MHSESPSLTLAAASRWVTSCPSNRIVPSVTSPCSVGSSPEMALSVVDFPAPLEPSSATVLPSGTASDNPRNTRMTSS